MRLFLYTTIFILFPTSFFAQHSARMDSILHLNKNYAYIVNELWEKCAIQELEGALNKEEDEQVRLKLIGALCFVNFNSNPGKALDYAKMQMALAEKLKMKDAIEGSYDNF